MTLRSRKKPPTIAPKPATALEFGAYRTMQPQFSLCMLLAGTLCLVANSTLMAQTTKPTWSAQRSKASSVQPKKTLATAAVNEPVRRSPAFRPAVSISKSLLDTKQAHRTSFAEQPRNVRTGGLVQTRPQSSLSSVPLPQPQAWATPKTNTPRSGLSASEPVSGVRHPSQAQQQDAKKKSLRDRVATTQPPRPPRVQPASYEAELPEQSPAIARPFRQVAQSRKPLIRAEEMPRLLPTPSRNMAKSLDKSNSSQAKRSLAAKVHSRQERLPKERVAQEQSTPLPSTSIRPIQKPARVGNGPKSIAKRIDVTPKPKSLVRQPGSLRQVQFQEPVADDGLDDDFFAIPEPAAATPTPEPETSFRNTTGDRFQNTADPSLFRDDTPAGAFNAETELESMADETTAETMPEPRAPASRFAPRSPEADTAPSAAARTEENPLSKSGADLQKEIDQALQQIDPLPSLSPSGEAEEELPANDDDLTGLENPLADGLDDLDPSLAGESLTKTNGRDCEAADGACKDELAFLRKRQRTDMSLDITPSIEPREFDMTTVEQTRVEKLMKAPSRTWTDRKGHVIADGTFDDYRFGKVVVRTVNGTVREIAEHRLSNDDRCFVNSWWELPDECHFEDEQFVLRDFRASTFTWAAAATCHKPLYFEEKSLERYGHTAGPLLQPLASGVHFFGNILMMPYNMGLTPPNECVYPLGHYRPGDCAPWIVPGFPMTTRGFKWEAAVLGAGIALLP